MISSLCIPNLRIAHETILHRTLRSKNYIQRWDPKRNPKHPDIWDATKNQTISSERSSTVVGCQAPLAPLPKEYVRCIRPWAEESRLRGSAISKSPHGRPSIQYYYTISSCSS